MKFNFYKRSGMSTMGYMIAIVIVLGLIMIISAPFMIDNSKESNKNNEQIQEYNNESDNNLLDVSKIDQRFERLETQINLLKENSSNKYVCTIGGTLDSGGNIVPIEDVSVNKKFVFICDYNF